jgi:hypothetical protein
MPWFKKVRATLYKAFVKFMENAMSKKFLVFITATALLSLGHIPATIWLPVALGVLGVQGALDYKSEPRTFHHDEPATIGLEGPPEIP